MQAEYGVETQLEPLGFSVARWVTGGWPALEKVGRIFNCSTVKDQVCHLKYLKCMRPAYYIASRYKKFFLITCLANTSGRSKYRSESARILETRGFSSVTNIIHVSVAVYLESVCCHRALSNMIEVIDCY